MDCSLPGILSIFTSSLQHLSAKMYDLSVQSTQVDATSASSILATLTANSTGYIQVANSLLVAIGQNKSSGVESAIRNIVNNQTGNTSYPATAINNTVSGTDSLVLAARHILYILKSDLKLMPM